MSGTGTPISAERLTTAKLAMRFLRAPQVRATLGRLGLLSCPVVLAEYGTPEVDVRSLVGLQRGADRVLVLVRGDGDRFVAMVAAGPSDSGSVGFSGGLDGEATTIGQVGESLAGGSSGVPCGGVCGYRLVVVG